MYAIITRGPRSTRLRLRAASNRGEGRARKREFSNLGNHKPRKFRYPDGVIAFKSIGRRGRGQGNESTIYEADSRALTSLFRCHSRIFIGGPFIFPCLAQLQNALVNREAYVNYANERPGRASADGQLTIIRKINA